MRDVPFFSIIVPIYNAKDTLSQCINSVINQSFQSFELILVDDGSTDGSSEICDQFGLLSDRIKTIHGSNQGALRSRIKGMQVANGKYITGLDSDDYYADGYLNTLYNHLKEEKYDVAAWSYTQFGACDDIAKLKKDLIGEHDGLDFLRWVLESTIHSFVVKAFKRKLLESIDWSGTPDVRLSNDYCNTIPFIVNSKKTLIIDYYGYMYRIHSDSTSHMVTYSKIIDLCKVSEYGLELLRGSGLDDKKTKMCEHVGFMKVFFWRMIYVLKQGVLDRKQIDNILNQKAYVEAEDVEREDIFDDKTCKSMKFLRERRIEELIYSLK